jgi:pimeloyl-ACP methyl ester carboxylesterase
MMFQGSFYAAQDFFSATQEELFGGFYQVKTVEALLTNGFAVVAPDAMFEGDLFWDTNLPPWDTMIDMGLWPTAPDAIMLSHLFPMMESGKLGKLDMTRMHSAGISSGGYMSSRMAFFYAKQFKSVTIAAGSFYYCSGPLCAPPIQGLPGELKPDHPPTLFLQGLDDDIVPPFTMWLYADDLKEHNIPYRVVTCANCTHQWIPNSPTEVLNWVQKWNN